MVHYKDLHLATSIEDLNKMIQNNYKVSQVKKPAALLNAAKKLFQKSRSELVDQEMTYIIASRFLLVYENLLSLHNDKNYVEMMLGKEAQFSKNQTTDLKNELIKRYEKAQQKKVSEVDKKLIKPIVPIEKTLIFNNELFISCIDLFRALQNQETKVLILDARSPEDFLESHMDVNNIINIPENNIQAGLSAHKLGTTLNEDSKAIWDKRDTYDAIVLLDWDTSKSSYVASKVDKLRTAIVEWDLGRTYKEKPAVLNFGFMDWLEMYPMLCTLPNVLYTKSNRELDDLLNLEDIEYPIENEVNTEENKKPNVDLIEKVFDVVNEKETKITDYDLNIQNNLIDVQCKTKQLDILFDNKIDRKETKDTTHGFAKSQDFVNNDGRAAVDDDNMNKARKALDKDRQLLLDEARQAKKPKIPEIKNEITFKPVINRAMKPRTTTTVQSFESTLNTVKLGPVKYGLTGLVNIRNTCYMNCAIQCLRHIPQVYEYFGDNFKMEITRKSPVLINFVGQIFTALWSNLYICIRTQEFYNKFTSLKTQFRKGQHEDCMEFCNALFEILNEDMTRDISCKAIWSDSQLSWYKQHSGKNSFFISNFYQQYKVEINCLCQTGSTVKYEVENVMYLPIPKRPFKLTEIIQENLRTVEKIFCKKCNSDKTFTRTINYYSNVLVVSLKRQLMRDAVCVKNDSECYFSLDGLQLGHLKYKLVAVSLHYGSVLSGHYTAACLNPYNQKWYLFNDEIVQAVDLSNPQFRQSVYAFFYSVDSETPNYSIIGDYTREDSSPLKL